MAERRNDRGSKKRGDSALTRWWIDFKAVARHTLGLAAVCFALGIGVDLAASPFLLSLLPEVPARWTPTGLGWLYMTPVLLGQGLAAALRPDRLHQKTVDGLLQPPPETGRIAWVGPYALLVLALPAVALVVHWAALIAWGVVLALGLRFSLQPAAAVGGSREGLTLAWKAGVRPLWEVAWMGLTVASVAFIIANLVLGVAFLPLAKAASGGPLTVGSGFMVVAQVNLFLAVVTPMSAAVLSVAWQKERRRAWRQVGGGA